MWAGYIIHFCIALRQIPVARNRVEERRMRRQRPSAGGTTKECRAKELLRGRASQPGQGEERQRKRELLRKQPEERKKNVDIFMKWVHVVSCERERERDGKIQDGSKIYIGTPQEKRKR